MPLRRLPAIILALAPFLGLGLLTAVLALHTTPSIEAGTGRRAERGAGLIGPTRPGVAAGLRRRRPSP